jgi:hypothetical protein
LILFDFSIPKNQIIPQTDAQNRGLSFSLVSGSSCQWREGRLKPVCYKRATCGFLSVLTLTTSIGGGAQMPLKPLHSVIPPFIIVVFTSLNYPEFYTKSKQKIKLSSVLKHFNLQKLKF